MDNNKAKHIKKQNNGIFYTVLAMCLIAVGIAAWSAVSAFDDYTKSEEAPSEPQPPAVTEPDEIIVPEPEKPAGSELDNVEYTPPTTEETPKEDSPAPFIMPISGNIIKTFDSETLQFSSTLGDMRLHEGIDVAAEEGATVRAVRAGKVTEVYKDISLGYTVIIDHSDGITAKYCGLAANIPVAVGDEVASGAEIGTLSVVPAEAADEAHLHFEIIVDGKRVSPLEIMNME